MNEEMATVEVSPKQAAEALGVPERTLYLWLDGEKIPGAWQGVTGKWLIPLGGLEEFVGIKATRDGGRTRARLLQWVEENRTQLVA